MNDFKENQCRCCKKVFCCKKCRVNHENLQHGVFPECDICLYGKAILTNASEILLNHVKSVHWPLRCLFCKRFFGTTDELKRHGKCPVGLKRAEEVEKSPYTPIQSYNDSTYDSPPLSLLLPKEQHPNKNLNMFSNLATSTPMQRNDENNLLEHIPDAITPVDYAETENKDSVSKAKLDSDALLKRKVTFCETPMAESYRTQKNALKKKNSEKDAVSSSIYSGSTSSGIFYSVKEEPANSDLEQNEEPKVAQNQIPIVVIEDSDEEEKVENKENIDAKPEESTLWISAINVTSDITEEKSNATSEHSMIGTATPTASKQKKRQVNIVMPTPIAKTVEKRRENVAESKPEVKVENIIEETSPTKSTVNSKSNLCKTDEGNSEPSSNIQETVSETSINVQNRLWISMSRLFKNVTSAIQSVSSISEDVPKSLKRRSTEYDSIDGPSVKRYKLTEIKCRPTIRQLPITRTASWEIHESFRNSYEKYRRKNYVDKATQTDDYLFEAYIKTNEQNKD